MGKVLNYYDVACERVTVLGFLADLFLRWEFVHQEYITRTCALNALQIELFVHLCESVNARVTEHIHRGALNDNSPPEDVLKFVEQYEFPNDRSNEIALPQFTAALKLAATHGHYWAETALQCELLKNYARENNGISIDLIQKIGLLFNYTMYGGIMAPALEHGNIVHRTGSGRLQWSIAADGSVTAQVLRPHDWIVAEAEIRDNEWLLEVNSDCFYDRHLSSLQCVFSALGFARDTLANVSVQSEYVPTDRTQLYDTWHVYRSQNFCPVTPHSAPSRIAKIKNLEKLKNLIP